MMMQKRRAGRCRRTDNKLTNPMKRFSVSISISSVMGRSMTSDHNKNDESSACKGLMAACNWDIPKNVKREGKRGCLAPFRCLVVHPMASQHDR